MDKQLKRQLSRFIDGRVCVMAIGNRHHHDEGVGPYVAEAMETYPEFDVINAGIVPEDHIEMVARNHPGTILLVEATDFGGEPGEITLIYPDKVAYSGVSRQAGSLRMLTEYLQASTHARIGLLAIQPEDMSDGDGLSPLVTKTLDDLLEVLPDICGHTTSQLHH